MIVNNNNLIDSDHWLGKISSNGKLPLNLFVDDCNDMENNNKIDMKRDCYLMRKWDKKNVHTMLTKFNEMNHSFDNKNSDLKEVTMDPTINDLNKRCEDLTLTQKEQCLSNLKSSDFKDKKEEDFKIFSELLHLLKIHKAQLDSLNTGIDVESNELVLRSRGHVKKNSNKNRSTPFDKTLKSRPERINLSTEPSLTLTTNNGNKACVYIQNVADMEGETQPQEILVPRFYHDQVILQALSDQQLLDQIIEDLETELSKTEATQVQSSTDVIGSQITYPEASFNVQCEPSQNNFNNPYSSHTFSIQDEIENSPALSHPSFNPYSSQYSDINFALNTQQNHFNFSPQHIGHMVSVSPQSISSAQTFENSPLTRTSLQEAIYSQNTQCNSLQFAQTTNTTTLPSQKTFFNISDQSNIITKPSFVKNSQSLNPPLTCSSQCIINYAQQHSEALQPNVSPVPQHSPNTQTIISPTTSPCNIEATDSSYETGSPSSSSAVTSPGSPYFRSSISSESDQEFNIVEPHFVKSRNIIDDQSASFIKKSTPPSKASLNKPGQTIKPLGKIIQSSTKSAEETLDQLSKAASWKGHYIVQLVRVAISTKKNPDDCVEGFRESLMNTINTQMDKKHEKVWQLAIFVHLEFLKAPARVKEYKTALLRKNEKEPSLLYIAAVERNCPLIARYIAEIMNKVGYDPGEGDEKGNTILHVLACLGDSYAEVLAELLASYDAQKKIFNAQAKNKEGKSLLHVAAASPQPQITTIVLLINYGADPVLEDKFGKTALYYHLIAMSKRMENNQCHSMDMEVTKKLLPPSSIECRKALDKLSSNLPTSNVLRSFIEEVTPKLRRLDHNLLAR